MDGRNDIDTINTQNFQKLRETRYGKDVLQFIKHFIKCYNSSRKWWEKALALQKSPSTEYIFHHRICEMLDQHLIIRAKDSYATQNRDRQDAFNEPHRTISVGICTSSTLFTSRNDELLWCCIDCNKQDFLTLKDSYLVSAGTSASIY